MRPALLLLFVLLGQAPAVPASAVFLGIEAGTVYDTLNFGKLGGVWAGMPGPYDAPITCRCGTREKPVVIRLRIEGVGGAHVTVADEDTRRLLSTVDVDIPPHGGMLVAWLVNTAVRFNFGPGSNLRNLFLDPAVPLASITHPVPWIPEPKPSAPKGVRVEKDQR